LMGRLPAVECDLLRRLMTADRYFLEDGNEALNPSQNGGVYDRDAALRHQVAHITIIEFTSDVPPHGLNDKKMVEIAAVEERGLLTRESSHANYYP
jgi:hypothetical protein